MDSELVICFIIVWFAVFAVLAGIVLWIIVERRERCRRNDEDLPPPPPLPHYKLPWTFYWLLTLTIATMIVLVVQLLLGFSVRALVLLADSAHGASDCSYYGVAAFAEFLKYKFGQSTISLTLSNKIDMASAGFSIVILVTTSVAVVVEAIIQFRNRRIGDEPGLGTAMLIVACLGVAVNTGLLAIHRYFKRGSTEEDSERSALQKQYPGRTRPRQGSNNTKRVFNVLDSGIRPRQGSDNNKTGFNVLHSGCAGIHECSFFAGNDHGANLNTYGVLIHIWADVARTGLMIVIGVLMETRVLKHAKVVDLICALVVSGMVLIGSAVLMHKVWLQTHVFSASGHGDDNESHDSLAQDYGTSKLGQA